MNSVNLTGRLTREPSISYTTGDNATCIARFTLACDRRFKRDGEASADFISCVAFGKTAEFVQKYFTKGTKMEVTGRIQTGSYVNKDGVKVYTTDVIAEVVGFGESKNASQSNVSDGANTTNTGNAGFMNIPDGIDEELPFN